MPYKTYLCVLLYVFLATGGALATATSGGLVDAATHLGITTDKEGEGLATTGPGDNAAFIYVDFWLAGNLSFKITGADVWFLSNLAPGEDATQDSPIVIENVGGILLDVGFGISNEDIIAVINPWKQDTASWAAPTSPGEYTLGLIACDNDVVLGPDSTDEWQNEDILPIYPLIKWYDTAGTRTMGPTTDSLKYAYEGSTSLALRTGAPDNTVHMFFRMVMSTAGSFDTGEHAAQIIVIGRASTG